MRAGHQLWWGAHGQRNHRCSGNPEAERRWDLVKKVVQQCQGGRAKVTIVVSLMADILPALATLQERAASNDWISRTVAESEEKNTLFNDIRNKTYERAGKLEP